MALRRYVSDIEPPEVSEVTLNSDAVINLKPSDVRYRSLQNVFATTIRQDLVSGNNIGYDSRLHDHHIFPRNARKQGLPARMLDGICNRVPVLEESNQRLGEAYPQEYFGQLADQARSQGTIDGLRRRLRDCMIPGDPSELTWPDSFSLDKFEDFCRSRAELVVARVREVVGDSLRVTPSSEDELVEDSEI